MEGGNVRSMVGQEVGNMGGNEYVGAGLKDRSINMEVEAVCDGMARRQDLK